MVVLIVDGHMVTYNGSSSVFLSKMDSQIVSSAIKPYLYIVYDLQFSF